MLHIKKELRENIISIEKELEYIEIKFDISKIDYKYLNEIQEKTFIKNTIVYYFEKGFAYPRVTTTGNNSLIDLWYNDFLEHVFKSNYHKYNEVLQNLYNEVKTVGNEIAIKEGFKELDY